MSSVKLALSAIIITKNEERNIARCLQSLAFCDEVVVFDSFSTDKTVEICRSFSNVNLQQTEWLGYSETKQRAAIAAKNLWILWIDADEELPSKLIAEIQKLELSLQPQKNSVCMFGFPRKTFVGNLWVSHGGWYPGIVWRLFHRDFVKFDGKVLHEGLEFIFPESKRQLLKSDLNHFSYLNLEDYFFKMVKYAKIGAIEGQRVGKKGNFVSVFLEPIFSFVKFFFLKSGFKMGFAGLVLAIGSAASTFFRYSYLWWFSSGFEPLDSNKKQITLNQKSE